VNQVELAGTAVPINTLLVGHRVKLYTRLSLNATPWRPVLYVSGARNTK